MSRKIGANVFELFNGRDEDIPETPLEVARPTPTGVPVAAGSAVDLTGKPKIIMCFGPGRVGKSFLLRWMIERSLDPDLILATMDAGRSTLVRFFPDYTDEKGKPQQRIMRPPSADGMMRYLERLIVTLVGAKRTAAIDFPSDESLVPLLSDLPALQQFMLDGGVEPIALYMLSTREEDLTVLKAMEESEFKPTATALIRNMATSPANPKDREGIFASFAPICRHSVYRAAAERGAIEVWLPRLFTDMVDRRGLGFQQATNGGHLGWNDRERVSTWLSEMDKVSAPWASWLP